MMTPAEATGSSAYIVGCPVVLPLLVGFSSVLLFLLLSLLFFAFPFWDDFTFFSLEVDDVL